MSIVLDGFFLLIATL